MLAIAEWDGQRSGGPVLLAGLVLGFGVAELAAEVPRQPTQET